MPVLNMIVGAAPSSLRILFFAAILVASGFFGGPFLRHQEAGGRPIGGHRRTEEGPDVSTPRSFGPGAWEPGAPMDGLQGPSTTTTTKTTTSAADTALAVVDPAEAPATTSQVVWAALGLAFAGAAGLAAQLLRCCFRWASEYPPRFLVEALCPETFFTPLFVT